MQISSSSITSSTYTNASYSSSGFSSMISGMDTESLVKSMLSGIQTKIDTQKQQKQQLLWKQEMYRSVISDISSFQTKYFDLTSSTSLRTSGFYSQMTTASSNSAVNVLSASSSSAQDFSIQVAQKATATTVTSGKIGDGTIQLNDIANSLESFFNSPEQNLVISAGDKSVSVNLWGENCLDENGDFSVDNALVEINSQLSSNDINVQASITDGKISFTSSSDGGADEVEYKISGSSNALSALGLKAASVGSDGNFTYEAESEADASKLEKNLPTSASINFTLDGKTKVVTIDSLVSADDAITSLKSQLKSAFGSSVTVNDDNTISVKQGQTLGVSGDSEALGITSGSCTRLTVSTKLSDLGIEQTDGKYEFSINGTDFSLDGDTTISDLLSKVNASDCGAKMVYNSLSDSFTLTASSTGEGFSIDVSGNVADKLFSKKTETAGQNAIVNIDGTTVERTSNTISYNGVTMEIKSTTGDYYDESGNLLTNSDGTLKTSDGTTDSSANITATRDVTKIMDTIKSFVSDYNKLIETLNGLTHASKTYKDYDPLTDDQKSEMKDSEITSWEEKSKEGLLSGDSDISSFLQSMRTTLYSKTSSGYTMSAFGIDSSSDWKEYGKLEIDEDTLKSALEANPDDVINTFKSVATDLNTACKNAANTSSASPGALVSLAGVTGKISETQNTIQTRLDNIADKITQLQDIYDLRKTRYWNQFNSMETALSNMSSTSSYLTQMLGG